MPSTPALLPYKLVELLQLIAALGIAAMRPIDKAVRASRFFKATVVILVSDSGEWPGQNIVEI